MSTADEAVARLRAIEWVAQVRLRLEQGASLKRITFNELCAAYVRTIMGVSKLDYHSQTIERHLKPFFEGCRDVGQISDSMIADYLVHRRTKTAKPPQPQTLNRENTVLRQLLAFAHVQRWTGQKIAVPYLSEAQTARRRRHFTPQEYQQLLATAARRITQARQQGEFRHVLDNRLLMLDVILILANSGLRVDELHSLTWRGVIWRTGDIQLERAGKRKSSRKVILRPPAIAALRRIAQRRKIWLSRRSQPAELDPSLRVIALPSGEPVKDQKRAFRKLLAECGFEYDSVDDRHALTSLRHTYATQRLTQRRGQRRITQDILAKQMGTSPRMILAHYGHDSVEDYRDELSK